MNSYRELLLRHTIGLSSLPCRIEKRILRDKLKFVLARPQMVKLTRGLLAYFPILGDLRGKAYVIADTRVINSQSGKTNESYKSPRDSGMKNIGTLVLFWQIYNELKKIHLRMTR